MIAEPMLQRDDFESFYTKKLEALVVELKAVIKGDIPYATSLEFACEKCSGRVKVHAQGEMYCLGCAMPYWWSRELKNSVSGILESYPLYEQHKKVWAGNPDHDNSKLSKQEIGMKIRKARIALGLNQTQLANKIFKEEGSEQTISQKRITDYELGKTQPAEYILEQLEQVLSVELRRGAEACDLR